MFARTIYGAVRVMGADVADQHIQRVTAAQRSRASDKAHVFTTETARKAALKSWKRRLRNSGLAPNRPLVKRPAVSHAALRAAYTNTRPMWGVRPLAIWYTPLGNTWWLHGPEGVRAISERAALRRLGHLKLAKRTLLGPLTILKRGIRR